MRPTTTALAMSTVLALGVAGCGGDEADVADDEALDETTEGQQTLAPDGTEAEETEAPTATEPATEDTDTQAADGATVVVEDIAYQDQTVTVPAGTAVTWDNQDSVAHTVTAGDPGTPTGRFDEDLPPDGEVSVTVEEPGTYSYFCEIHPQMTAELVVEPAS